MIWKVLLSFFWLFDSAKCSLIYFAKYFANEKFFYFTIIPLQEPIMEWGLIFYHLCTTPVSVFVNTGSWIGTCQARRTSKKLAFSVITQATWWRQSHRRNTKCAEGDLYTLAVDDSCTCTNSRKIQSLTESDRTGRRRKYTEIAV